MQPTSNAWGCKTISNFKKNDSISSASVSYFPNIKFIPSARKMSEILIRIQAMFILLKPFRICTSWTILSTPTRHKVSQTKLNTNMIIWLLWPLEINRILLTILLGVQNSLWFSSLFNIYIHSWTSLILIKS